MERKGETMKISKTQRPAVEKSVRGQSRQGDGESHRQEGRRKIEEDTQLNMITEVGTAANTAKERYSQSR